MNAKKEKIYRTTEILGRFDMNFDNRPSGEMMSRYRYCALSVWHGISTWDNSSFGLRMHGTIVWF